MLDLHFPIAPDIWDTFVTEHPNGHILQTSPWGALKSQFGWRDQRVGLAHEDRLVAGAQMLTRRLPTGLGRLAYVPKGPLVNWEDEAQVTAMMTALDRAEAAAKLLAVEVEA